MNFYKTKVLLYVRRTELSLQKQNQKFSYFFTPPFRINFKFHESNVIS